nr:MFS transporter [Bacillus swezeyi]
MMSNICRRKHGFGISTYGAAIPLWIQEDKQGKANTWINSGTSFGIILSGAGAYVLTPNWRLTYLIYAILTFMILIWNVRAIPKVGESSSLMFKKGNLYTRSKRSRTFGFGISYPGNFHSGLLDIFRSFMEAAGEYSDWQLSGFWVVIGLFGVPGEFSGSLVERWGLSVAYKWGSLSIASASIMLSFTPGNWFMPYISAGIFGCS